MPLENQKYAELLQMWGESIEASFKELNTLLQLSEKDGAKIIFKPLLDALDGLSSKTHENLTESANLVGIGASTLEFLVFLLKKQNYFCVSNAHKTFILNLFFSYNFVKK